MSAETAVVNFIHVCNALYIFSKKPTIAVHYKGVHLKHLLEQRWMGHLATVSIILKSFNDITSLLNEIESVLAYGAEIRMEAVGLLRKMTEPSFSFIAKLVHTVLALLDPPNKLRQREDTDLMTGLNMANATACVRKLRCDEEFNKVWDITETRGPQTET